MKSLASISLCTMQNVCAVFSTGLARRISLLLLATAFIGSMELSAQRMWLMGPDTSFRSKSVLIDVHGDGFYRSNALDNTFLDKLAFGGTIDRSLVNEQQARMGDALRAGARYQTGVRFMLMQDSVFKQANWGWQGIVQLHGHAEIGAPADLFNLVFEGNSPNYLGKSANLNTTWIDYMSYQKVGVGVFHKPTLSGFTISAVNGQDFERLEMVEGSLFTSESGDSLALTYNGHWLRSDTATRGFGAGNGLGAALDGVLNIPLKENKGFVSISVHNIGFVQWNEATQHFSADSVFSFTGVNLQDIIDEDGDGVPSFEDSLYYTTEEGTMTRWLPGWAHAKLMHTLTERSFFEVGMTFRSVPAFIPELNLGYFRTLSSRTLVGATVNYGGYGNLRVGVSAEQWFGKRFFAALNIEDVYGPLAPKGLGAAMAVRLTYMIDRNVE